jgi:hypothetical protein
MAVANTVPIWSKVADVQWIGAMVTANNTKDITSGTSYLVFTADATNGGFLREIRLKADPANNTAATVLRVFINNGSTTGTASNSTLFTEISVPATTAAAATANPDIVASMNIPLPPGYKVYLTLGTAPGGSGQFSATAVGGKY